MRFGQVFAVFLMSAVAGCGGGERSDSEAKTGDKPPSEKKTAPESSKSPRATTPLWSKANFTRIHAGTPVSEVVMLFGPAEGTQDGGGGVTQYTWGPKEKRLWISAKRGVVEFVRWPGSDEFFKRRQLVFDTIGELAVLFTDHALVSGSRLPAKLADLKTKRTPSPNLVKLIESGEIVAPWGETANQLVWGWWNETPEFGGPYLRYDVKRIEYVAPGEFKSLRETKLNVKTIPEEYTKGDNTSRGEPGFFLSTAFMNHLRPCIDDPKIPPPRSLAEYPLFMVRDADTYAAVKAVAAGAVVVHWDGHPAKGVYLHNAGFEKHSGWAIWNASFHPCETAGDAARLLEKK